MIMDELHTLKTLLSFNSKHSNYQILPQKLALLMSKSTDVKSKYEKERLKFILENIDIKEKNIIDIGGNTGYFSFELLEKKAKHIDFYEGNKDHANFVRLASGILGYESKIKVIDEYFFFEDELKNKYYDIALLLNVLHHLGDDYGDKKLTMEIAKRYIISQINSLAHNISILVFQLGFNWKGNRNKCLFTNGTKKELIDFVQNGTSLHWDIIKIGIAEEEGDKIFYNQINNENIKRNDSMGEFLNRPIFFLKSKKIQN